MSYVEEAEIAGEGRDSYRKRENIRFPCYSTVNINNNVLRNDRGISALSYASILKEMTGEGFVVV